MRKRSSPGTQKGCGFYANSLKNNMFQTILWGAPASLLYPKPESTTKAQMSQGNAKKAIENRIKLERNVTLASLRWR